MADEPEQNPAGVDEIPGVLFALAIGGIILTFGLISKDYWMELLSDPPEVRACENYIMVGLRAPSTYKRVSVDPTMVDDQLWVSIVYDAENVYGAPVRGSELCRFKVKGGEAIVPYVPDPESELAIATQRLNESIGLKREPCCLE